MVSKLKPELICQKCEKVYIYVKSYEKHVFSCIVNLKSSIKKPFKANKDSISKKKLPLLIQNDSKYGIWSDVFNFDDQYWSEQQKIISFEHDQKIVTYLNYLSDFADKHSKDLKILHLNINSIYSKVDSVHEILDSDKFDILFFNETKLNVTIPDSHISHSKYKCYRRDRDYLISTGQDKNGGGILIYIRKEYVHSVQKSDSFETMHLSLMLKDSTYNFLAAYKSPSQHSQEFVDYLDNIISGINLNDPLFIIGDLNMDLLPSNSNSNPLKDFITFNKFQNVIKEPTRERTRFFKASGDETSSSTLIDILIHNKELVSATEVVPCPYSDHKFIIATIKTEKDKPESEIFWSRNLSESNINLVEESLKNLDFSKIDELKTPNDKWVYLKNLILTILDTHAPLKKVTLKPHNKFPWFDLELYRAKKARDTSYATATKTNFESDWNIYKEFRKVFQKLNRSKLLAFFEKKGTKDFKNSKKFWEFYKTSIKIRSDRAQSDAPLLIIDNEEMVADPVELSNLFNNFFTSISSVSISNKDECVKFTEELFNKMKIENKLKTSLKGFSFHFASVDSVKQLIQEMEPSSPGTSGISSKIMKLIPDTLAPIFTKIINSAISSCSIPEDWKSALVTPLFKNKGKTTDLNNYRGISVLLPMAKIFEKVLAMQITRYFEKNKLFTPHQHGFRKGHSCETALHELISDLNLARDKKLTNMLLFIDFKKAFDTVDSKLLLAKLFHYGFDTDSLLLISDYFKGRYQKTKIGNVSSKPNLILLGVPQGSILGPLFFLIFINDLLSYLVDVNAKLFADDTTLYSSGAELDDLTARFSSIIRQLLDWCSKNRLDINWSKTFFMIITKKRIKIPESFTFGNINIKCVSEFKLLGVTIDNKLSFKTHLSNISHIVNSKLFSIKRIFYLSTSVKVQFFKTFILPYFDYCSTLLIYCSKSIIQKFANKYYLCLHKLFNFDTQDFTDFNDVNTFLLQKFDIPAFQHRFFQRLSVLSFKLLNFKAAPEILKDDILKNYLDLSNFQLNPLLIPESFKELRSRTINIFSKDIISKYKIKTFSYFSNVFLNCFNLNIFNLSYKLFMIFFKEYNNVIYTAITNTFAYFNLEQKKYAWVKALA